MLSPMAQQLLSFLSDHFTATGKRGIYATRDEIAELAGLSSDNLPLALKQLENSGLASLFGHTGYGVPYIHLTDRGVSSINSSSNSTNSSNSTTTIANNDKGKTLTESTPGVHEGAASPATTEGSAAPMEHQTAPALAPRVHFFEAVAKVRDVFTHQDLDFQDSAARVEVTFGQYRRKITLRISMNKPGLSPAEFRHALGKAWALIEQKLGRQVARQEFSVVNLHLNLGFLNLRLEGCKSITLADAETWLRLYEKGSVLRSEEVLGGGALSLDKAMTLVATSYGDRIRLEEIHRGINQILDILGGEGKQGELVGGSFTSNRERPLRFTMVSSPPGWRSHVRRGQRLQDRRRLL